MFCTLLALSFLLDVALAKMGPFVVEVKALDSCNFTMNTANYKVDTHLEKYEKEGRSLIRWNMTVPKTDGPLKLKLRACILQNVSYVPIYQSDVSPCQHRVVSSMMSLAKIAITRRCKLPKGTYSVGNLDPNELIHAMTRVLEYGSLMITMEWHVPSGTIVCTKAVVRSRPLHPGDRSY